MARAKRKNHSTHSTHHSSARHRPHHSRGENGAEHAGHSGEEMIAAGRAQIDRMQKGAKSAFDIFSGPMSHMMDRNLSAFQKMFQVMQEESLRFFNRRVEHTSHVIENNRDFQGIAGLMHLQQEWMLDFARDCSEQATRFAQLMRDVAVDSTERFADASSESLEEIEAEEDEDKHGEHHRAAA